MVSQKADCDSINFFSFYNTKFNKGDTEMEVKNKQSVCDEIWLNYFNDVLYDKGIITETQRNKMKHLIHNRCANIAAKNKKLKYTHSPAVITKVEKMF